jgi:hypothetical protein
LIYDFIMFSKVFFKQAVTKLHHYLLINLNFNNYSKSMKEKIIENWFYFNI